MDHSYLAGFFDGEGCIAVHKHKRTDKYAKKHPKGNRRPYYRLRLVICNTNLEVLKQIQEAFGGSVRLSHSRSGGNRPCYTWERTGVDKAVVVLKAILPFLIIKKAQALEAIRFAELVWVNRNSGISLTGKQIAERDNIVDFMHALKVA